MIRKIALLIGVMVLGIGVWLWTPNSNFEETFDKYAKPDSQFLTLDNGQRLHYRDFGNADGSALILVHGTSDSLLTWDALTAALGSQWRFISLDLPGHGFSGQHPNDDYTMSGFVETLNLLMKELDVAKATMAGNSLGGGIAWQFALNHPEKVDALVLLDPSGAPRTVKPKSNIGFKLLRSPVGRFFGRRLTPRAMIEQSLKDSVADSGLATSQRVDQYWDLLRLPGNREALISLASRTRSDEPWQNIEKVTTPTLIIWGEEDQLIPVESAKKFAAALPNNQLIIYENIGHLPMVEAPQRLASDIERFVFNQGD